MGAKQPQSRTKSRRILSIRRLFTLLAPRAYTVIMFGAIFCTLAVKLFHSLRCNLVYQYFGWILSDLSVLLGIEIVLAAICFRWPRRWIVRAVTVFAALVCTWSVINAGWLIRTGTQVLPTVLLPLLRDPINSLGIIGTNLAAAPRSAVVLLAPSAVALTFFFCVLAKPAPPNYNRRRFAKKAVITLVIIFAAVILRGVTEYHGSPHIASVGMRYNSQYKAVISLFRRRFEESKRRVPYFDQVQLALGPQQTKQNMLVVVLEGVQYRYTSLARGQNGSGGTADVEGPEVNDLTPFLAELAGQGVEFTNARSSVTHTTKALFALLTGRFPSASEDLAEAVPAKKPYASIATALSDKLGYRTAFFQSAKGNFESRPGLVHNLGFDEFWSRDDLPDPNGFLGYLACDEFVMLKHIAEWIRRDDKPFFLTVLCSVTHDPYEIPEWYGEPADEPIDCYKQSIAYTDGFLKALDGELDRLGLADETILCVVGDHGEAFGEHGQLGHERIVFEEVLRIPFCLRARSLVRPGTKVAEAVSSVDLTPTLLGLLGFEVQEGDFDGHDILAQPPRIRRVYFSGWMHEGPAGFVEGDRKLFYNPTTKRVYAYDLIADPFEVVQLELPEEQAEAIAEEIAAWRKNSVFRLDRQQPGREMLYGRWFCRWTNRVFLRAEYRPLGEN